MGSVAEVWTTAKMVEGLVVPVQTLKVLPDVETNPETAIFIAVCPYIATKTTDKLLYGA